MATTDARLIVLATVQHLEPATGYAVRKHLVDQGVEQWAGVSVASIYSVLKTLTRHGHLEDLADPTGVRANTRAYRTTAQGRDELLALWRTAVETIDAAHPVAFHVAITLTGLIPADLYREGLTNRLAQYERLLAMPLPPLPPEALNAARLWRALAETEATWLRETLASL